jgi:hypothetical protein
MKKESPQALREHLASSPEVRQIIARRAYEIYEQRGHAPGQDKEDWIQAENEVLSRLVAERLQGARTSNNGSALPVPPSQRSKPAEKKRTRTVVKARKSPLPKVSQERTEPPITASVAEESKKNTAKPKSAS